MKRVDKWAFGLIQKEVNRKNLPGRGCFEETTRLKVIGVCVHKKHVLKTDTPPKLNDGPLALLTALDRVLDKELERRPYIIPEIERSAERLAITNTPTDQLNRLQIEGLALQIEKDLALKLPVSAEWLKKHFRGHITNNLKAGLDPAHIRDVVAKMAARKAQRGGWYR